MKLLSTVKILIACAVVGVLVALVYLGFEWAVSYSTVYLWNTVVGSDEVRWLVFPLALGLGLLFFGLQEWLAPGSENKEEHSLGGTPIKPTIRNLAIVLLLGFFSLLAGATLGPEAILVPASMIVGGYIGVKAFKQNNQVIQLLGAAALMALMAAFFHSFIVGLLSVLLVAAQAKTKVSIKLLIIAVIASASSYYTLQFLDPSNSYFVLPPFTWASALEDVFVVPILIVLGYCATFAVKYSHTAVKKIRSLARFNTWWKLALVSGLGIGTLYYLGGPLVEFTGNKSMAPLADQALGIGMVGLIVILLTKIVAIAWSKAMGYRGGMIFPMVFVASALVIIMMFIFPHAHFGLGMIAALVGIFVAEAKAKILF